jgi:hypothetical protein
MIPSLSGTPPAGVRVLIATRPVNFRRGADGLAATVQSVLRCGFKAGLHLRSGTRCSGPELCTAKQGVLARAGYLHQSRLKRVCGRTRRP